MDEVLVHPVVLLNMADHRMRAGPTVPCVGIVFGTSAGGVGTLGGSTGGGGVSGAIGAAGTGGTSGSGSGNGAAAGSRVELLTSVDVRVKTDGVAGAGSCSLELDVAILTAQRELLAKVFPALEPLGWYLVSSSRTAPSLYSPEAALHAQVAAQIQAPLLLHLCDAGLSSARELPLAAYMGDATAGGGINWVPLATKLEANEVERITVDHVTQAALAQATEKQLAATHESLQQLATGGGGSSLASREAGSSSILAVDTAIPAAASQVKTARAVDPGVCKQCEAQG